jgi:hypothetical protein
MSLSQNSSCEKKAMCFSPRIFEGLGLLAPDEEKRGNLTFKARVFNGMYALSVGEKPPTSDLTLALLLVTCCDVVPSDSELTKINARVFTKSVLKELRTVLETREDVELGRHKQSLSESAWNYLHACLVKAKQTEAEAEVESKHLGKKQRMSAV